MGVAPRIALVAVPLLLAACQSFSASQPASATAGTALAAQPPSAPMATLASTPGDSAQALDLRMVALTKDILSCPYDRHAFHSCPALDAFAMNRDAYLQSEDADKALVDMITGPDERLATIASKRRASDRKFSDKLRIAKLFGAAERSGNPYDIESAAVSWLARVDMESLGFADRLNAIARNPAIDVRRAFASGILVSPSDKTAAFELVTTLLRDTDDEVAARAAGGLARVATPAPRVCDVIRDAVDREDSRTDRIVSTIGTADCDGVAEKVIGYVGKRTGNGNTIPEPGGNDLSQALWVACRNRRAGDDAKNRAYSVGLSMTKDPEARESALEVLASCDPKKAEHDLEKFTHDADELVQNVAMRRIEELKKRAP